MAGQGCWLAGAGSVVVVYTHIYFYAWKAVGAVQSFCLHSNSIDQGGQAKMYGLHSTHTAVLASVY
jgi:hypothetical protein